MSHTWALSVGVVNCGMQLGHLKLVGVYYEFLRRIVAVLCQCLSLEKVTANSHLSVCLFALIFLSLPTDGTLSRRCNWFYIHGMIPVTGHGSGQVIAPG